ncbi:MAG: zf-HC2 domain-containing protein [Actinomycetota bacterium]|nr:zf-HC2 domain-containing protein [Actinomycetota bacterium]
MSSPRCADVELLLPELALGTLTGEDRARALDHLGSCPHCSDELRKLNELGDQLLLLAPSAEPPVGFESLVVKRLGVGSRKGRLRKGILIAAAGFLCIALLSASVTYFVGRGDRELADSYREALRVANGEYVAARPLTDKGGEDAGYIFGYQGSPSWIFCMISPGLPTATYDVEVSSKDGRTWELGEIYVHANETTWGRSLPIPLHEVKEITLVAQSGDETLVAKWSDGE